MIASYFFEILLSILIFLIILIQCFINFLNMNLKLINIVRVSLLINLSVTIIFDFL